MVGVLVKAISGFYYCMDESGRVYEAKARGVFKKKGITPLVGDKVNFETGTDNSVVVTEILPRLNSFDRPPAANVETLVVVTAAKNPDPAFTILDRFLVSAEEKGTEIVLCINKCDLDAADAIAELKSAYAGIYPVFLVSGRDGSGIDELRTFLKGKQVALAGPSGVGKSTLTNKLLGQEESEVGEISAKSLKGKNTTRHTELFTGDGFMLFDTPGFTSFDAVLNPESELDKLFPEFKEYLGHCRFDDCKHLKEPECAVKAALESGKIHPKRYESYVDLYDEREKELNNRYK